MPERQLSSIRPALGQPRHNGIVHDTASRRLAPALASLHTSEQLTQSKPWLSHTSCRSHCMHAGTQQ